MSRKGDVDRRHMRRALLLARRGLGRVSPNPLVGAVVVAAGRVVGEGLHRRLGGAHAEIEALEKAGGSARGATLYVTLEPCCHRGRTGPCTEAIIARGVSRVVAALEDPFAAVRGKGVKALERAGIDCEVGLLDVEAAELNHSYLTHQLTGRPHVTLKQAVSLDGRIALGNGSSRYITGASTRNAAQRLRFESDAVMVGRGTALADDPALSARRGERVLKPLQRVVLDRRLRLPPGARLLSDPAGGPVLIYCGAGAAAGRRRALEATGALVLTVPLANGQLDLEAILEDLGSRGVGRLLVEGGGELAGSFVRRALVNRVVWHLAPILLGSDAIPAVGELALTTLDAVPGLGPVSVRRSGSDLLIEGEFIRDVHRTG